ncbi:MAG: DsrE/DsrF/DrsH-like family protein [Acidimicrobiales bacterium]|nr:DsrE/DsrF/DrsH-like family protein [Acidimicrobiales bacterium]
MAEKMSFIVFSGSADKLQAAATMVSGAAAMGVETHLFLTFWGLNAFRKDMVGQPLPMSSEAGDMAEMMGKLMMEKGVPPWSSVLADAIDIGDVHVHACAMTMDLMDMPKEALVDVVEDVIGVGRFIELSAGGSVVFI